MADGVMNIAKGKIAYYAGLPAANDALIVVLLKATGLEADDTLNNYDDLAALLAAANDEADATNYVRKTVTASITVTVDDTGNKVDIDMPDLTWTALGGASNNTIAKMLVCYDPDTTGGTDSTVIPLTYHDCTLTTDGTDVTVQIAAAGFARAA
jgi:hypothetical protein